jgi:hypothetical protein
MSAEDKKVSTEDMLRVQNLQLRMEKIQVDLQLLQMNIQQKLQQRDTIVLEMNKFKDEFQAKYGLDLATAKINEDGSWRE